jgi:hypothetical protein
VPRVPDPGSADGSEPIVVFSGACDPGTPAELRRRLQAQLADLGDPLARRADDVRLTATELATNAVQPARAGWRRSCCCQAPTPSCGSPTTRPGCLARATRAPRPGTGGDCRSSPGSPTDGASRTPSAARPSGPDSCIADSPARRRARVKAERLDQLCDLEDASRAGLRGCASAQGPGPTWGARLDGRPGRGWRRSRGSGAPLRASAPARRASSGRGTSTAARTASWSI